MTDDHCTHPGGCTKTPPLELALCREHASKEGPGQWLADIRPMWRALDPRHGVTDNGGRSGSLASQRSPVRIAVTVLTDRRRGTGHIGDDRPDTTGWDGLPSVFETLHTWATEVRDGRQLSAPTRFTVETERQLLVDHLDWCAEQDWWRDMTSDVRALWSALRTVHGEPPPTPAAACWIPVGDELCGGPVWSDPGKAWCGKCGASWTGLALLRIQPVLDGAA